MYQKMLLSERIVENIVDLIIKGFYKPGDKLPNEMQLSEELNISRATLREAIKTLESRNILEVRRGIGTFVSKVPGLSNDPMGFQFMALHNNTHAFFNMVQFNTYQMFNRITTIPKSDIDAYIRLHLPEEEHTDAGFYFNALFNIVEDCALYLSDEFSYRLMIILHQLFDQLIHTIDWSVTDEFIALFDKLVIAFHQKSIEELKYSFNELMLLVKEKVA